MGGSDLRRSALVESGLRVNALADSEPDTAEAIRRELAPHHRLFCERVVEGVRRRDRTAMNLYPRLVRAIGADSDLTAVLIAQLGVQSLDAARRVMEMAREADSVDSEALYERALRHVHEYRRRHGMPPLIEGVEVAHAAVGEATNGHANGHANGHGGPVPGVRGNGSGPPRQRGGAGD